MKMKEAALVRAAAKGDKEAFSTLIGPYRQAMYATAMAITHNEDDALDAIQDTLLTAWEKLSRLRDPGAFKTWLTRVLVNRCRGTLRGRSWETPEEELEEQGREPEYDTALDVNRALSHLSDGDRLILQFFYFQDMSVKEIAGVLGIAPEAVRMRLSRSRKRFKEQYGKEEAL